MSTTVAKSLIGQKEFPAISIIVPTHPQYPKFKIDREHMIELLGLAKNQLLSQCSKVKSNMLMDKLHHVVNGINFGSLTQGLAIYVSANVEKVISLPFEVTEKVIVDDSFEIRDLLYAAKLNRDYLVVAVSQNKVKSFLGYGSLLRPVIYPNMPSSTKDVTNEHSFPGWDYLDTQAYDEKNIHNFLRFIDDVIEKEMRGKDYPVIIMGDKKINGYLNHHTRNSARIIGYVDGNYEHTNLTDLARKVEPFIKKFAEGEILKAMTLLEQAVSKNTFSAGLTEVWRAAAEARGRLLLVEKDYHEAARFGDDSYSIIVDSEVDHARNKISDAVDDIIELVLKNNGDVVFVDNGKLSVYQRIAMITRY